MQIENRKDCTSILQSHTQMAMWEEDRLLCRQTLLPVSSLVSSKILFSRIFDFNCIFGCFDHHNWRWRQFQNEFLFWERYCAVPSYLRLHSNIWQWIICQSALLNFICAVPAFLSRIHDFYFFLDALAPQNYWRKGFQNSWQANYTNPKHLINIMDESLRERRIVGSFCTACNRRFATRFAYDQHRTSPFLIGTQCYALQRQNSELTANRRANLSTAVLRSTSRSRSGSPLHDSMKICQK